VSRAAPNARFYDMHCHLHEYSDREVGEILEELDVVIVAVSEDAQSFARTLQLASSYPERIVPCAGFHPWSLREKPVSEARELAREAARRGVTCIGEIGLDKKFMPPETWERQVEVARLFLELARDLDAYTTLHAPDAWRETLDLARQVGVARAMFHWYTGPLDLIDEITGSGYYISINPALRIQAKHRRVAERVPLEWMVMESDGPYNYRGLRLDPRMIPEAARIVADLKGLSVDDVVEAVASNSRRLLGLRS